MKNVLEPLTKSVLISLGLTAAACTTDTSIQKKIRGSECPLDLAQQTTTLVISNEEIKDIMKIVRSLEEPGLLVKGLCERIENEAKEQKRQVFYHVIWYIIC